MRAGTNLVVVGAVGVAGAGVAVARRAYRPAAAVLLAVVDSAMATTAVLKDLLDRPRPPAHLALVQVSGSAMPSTHAAFAMAAAVAWLVAGRGVAGSRRAVDPGGGPAASPRSRLAARVAVPGVEVVAGVVAAVAAAVLLVGACLVYLGAHWLTDVSPAGPSALSSGSARAGCSVPVPARPLTRHEQVVGSPCGAPPPFAQPARASVGFVLRFPRVDILPSAGGHGVEPEDIEHAVRRSLVIEEIGEDPLRFLVLGPDRAGNLLELVVLDRPRGPAVIHAMRMRPQYERLLPRR